MFNPTPRKINWEIKNNTKVLIKNACGEKEFMFMIVEGI